MRPALSAPAPSSGGVRPAFSAVAWSQPQDRQDSYKAPRLIGNVAVSRLRAIFITDYKAKCYPIHRCSDYSSAHSKPFVHKEIRLEPARAGLFRLFQRPDITRIPVKGYGQKLLAGCPFDDYSSAHFKSFLSNEIRRKKRVRLFQRPR
jgi:hypothetical protein